MKIKGINGMTIAQVQDEIACGGKFVSFVFCLSFVAVSFRYSSAVYFVKSNEQAFVKGLPYTLLSFLFGWWGIPFGVVNTAGCLLTNLSGGKNVTAETMKFLHRQTGGHVFEFELTEKFALA